jgi:hypothetical protein
MAEPMVRERRSGDGGKARSEAGKPTPSRQPRLAAPESLPAQERQDTLRERKKASVASEPARSPRRRPLVELCSSSGWQVQFLGSPPGEGDDLASLCIKELIAIREAGNLDLTIALADAAEAEGLRHPRIRANRERAQRGRERAEAKPQASAATPASGPAAMPRGKGKGKGKKAAAPGGARGALGRLRSALGLAKAVPSAPKAAASKDQPRAKPGSSSAPSAAVKASGQAASAGRATLPKEAPERSTASPSSAAAEQLRSLRAVCTAFGWAANVLGQESEGDVALACAREMQRCRQAGQHGLVVALGTEAALLGLEHERIRENLERSRMRAQRQSTLEQVQALLQGKKPASEAALTLLVEATLADPECPDYRRLLEECVGREIDQRSHKSLTPELRKATVKLEVNQRLLEAIDQRRQSEGRPSLQTP